LQRFWGGSAYVAALPHAGLSSLVVLYGQGEPDDENLILTVFDSLRIDATAAE
jgi:hypothetical protein